MSWKEEVKKEKFQGPPREYAKFQADEMYLGMSLRGIHRHATSTMKYLDKLDSEVVEFFKDAKNITSSEVKGRVTPNLKLAKGMLELVLKEIDDIDEKMLERAKYVGRKKQTYQFDERFDEDDLDYEGAKSPTLR